MDLSTKSEIQNHISPSENCTEYLENDDRLKPGLLHLFSNEIQSFFRHKFVTAINRVWFTTYEYTVL